MIISDDKRIVFIDMTLKNNQRLVVFTDIVFNFWYSLSYIRKSQENSLLFVLLHIKLLPLHF